MQPIAMPPCVEFVITGKNNPTLTP